MPFNSTIISVEQTEIRSLSNQKTQNMETSNQNTEIIPDQNMDMIAWTDIESTQADDAHDLDEIESFFREDYENDFLEELIF